MAARSKAARPLRLRDWIPPVAWMSVSCECFVLSDRGPCDEQITRPEESYRLWCVVVCDPESSWMKKRVDSQRQKKKKISYLVTTLKNSYYAEVRLFIGRPMSRYPLCIKWQLWEAVSFRYLRMNFPFLLLTFYLFNYSCKLIILSYFVWLRNLVKPIRWLKNTLVLRLISGIYFALEPRLC